MGAYICGVCDNMFCSHEVNFMHCDKCEISMCEGCWEDMQDERNSNDYDLCGECFRDLMLEAELQTEKEQSNE